MAQNHVCVHETVYGKTEKQNNVVKDIEGRMDVGQLTEPRQECLQQVIGRYQGTFSN